MTAALCLTCNTNEADCGPQCETCILGDTPRCRCGTNVIADGFQCEACARTLHANDPAPRFAAVEVPVEWERPFGEGGR